MIKSIKIMRKIFLFFILLFPMSVYSDVNNYQDSDYAKNNFSIKEQEYLKKYVLQSSAFLMRAVGNSKYSSSILSDQNNHFILEQSMNFYRKFDVKYLPKIVQKYLFQCFLINQMILNKSERNYFKTVILLNKKKVIPDIIMIDPPRKGMDENSIKNILKISPKKLVYISCNPATLVRDLAEFEEKYDVKTIEPVDMFPYSKHVECVSVLELK